MKWLPAAVLALSAAFSLLTAAGSGLQPQRFAKLLGLVVENPGGGSEIRAQYSGFFFALAALCALSLLGAVSRQAALVALIVTFGGLLAGRLVSLATNGGTSGFPPAIKALYLIDAAGLGLSLTALYFEQSARLDL